MCPSCTIVPELYTYLRDLKVTLKCSVRFSLFSLEPVIETFPKGEICVLEGESVALQVRVTGDPTPTLTWYHNGQEVAADYSTELREDGSLFIASSELRHGGLYRMMVHNSSGKEERSVKVRVYEEGAESAGPVQSGNSVSAAVSCIPVADFGNFVVESHSNNNSGFRKLFAVSFYMRMCMYIIIVCMQELYSGSEHPVTIGLSSQNKTRNRFANITVCELTAYIRTYMHLYIG